MSLKLYDFAAAPSPLRARIFLAEKGVEYENVQVNLGTGEQLSEDFRRINPACTVPVLVLEDGTTLTQNTAIAHYLEAAYPEPPLFGRNAAEMGLVVNASSLAEMGGLMAVAEVLRNSSPRMKDRALPGPKNYAQIPELAERGRARLGSFMETLDQTLEGREFLAIDAFSYADITAFVTVDFAQWVKVTPSEGQVNLKRWFEAVAGRESVRKAKGVK